jgi:hypothetical protein
VSVIFGPSGDSAGTRSGCLRLGVELDTATHAWFRAMIMTDESAEKGGHHPGFPVAANDAKALCSKSAISCGTLLRFCPRLWRAAFSRGRLPKSHI